MQNNVIGINIGSKYSYIKFYVRENDDHERFFPILSNSSPVIPTVVSFDNNNIEHPIIIYGKEAIMKRFNLKPIVYLNRWVGISSNNDFYKEELKYAINAPILHDI